MPWDAEALFQYLRQGWHPDHGVARGPMAEVVSNLSEVPESDVRAIATYMAGVFGAPTPERKRRGDEVLAQASSKSGTAGQRRYDAGAQIYAAACATCHATDRAPPFGGINLALSTALTGPDARNAANIVLSGIRPTAGERSPIMPGFADSMSDGQIAALLDYLRTRFGNQPPWTNTVRHRPRCQTNPDRIVAARSAMMTLKVNGQDHPIDADPDTPLLYVLREDLKLNAAKFGCGLGQCGACTVIVDGKAVLSCVTPMMLLEGKKVTTLEGLGTTETPAPIQRAFIEEQAAQCGYCIAGMMMRAQALLATQFQADRRRNPRRAAAQSLPLRHPYADPARRASRQPSDADRRRLARAEEHAMNGPVLNRRSVLAGGGALIISFSLRDAFADDHAAPAPKPPGSLERAPYLDAWIRIDADGTITVFTGKAELGQGFKTAFQQIAAEELDVAFKSVNVVTADTSRTANEGYTSGSNSMKYSGTAVQNAAAQVRALLIAEAARRLELPPESSEDRRCRGDRARRPQARLRRTGRRRHAACAGAADIEAEGPGDAIGSWASRCRASTFRPRSPAARPMSRTCGCPAWCMPAWCGRRATARN